MKTSAVAIALVLAASAQACVRTCEYTNDANGRCYYYCSNSCTSITAHSAASNFLAALQAKGYDCDWNGVQGVSCAQTSKFGACSGHYWMCGSGC
ncbi:hypothetical protein EMPS_11465 [Entomortierella parvispora]|uniref:Uncharacterized protein n=1 Tax=Entomortierella parvispora TaxID=205924 RepID=A0A9P3M1Z2_9FUNG|nr:hypothetical protein EMPS_11465 [Entomortierella parvispora]